MCCGKMTRIIGWIIRVIQGWYNWLFTKPNEETIRRRKICGECEYNKKGICQICGCVLKAKTASPNEKCLKGKW